MQLIIPAIGSILRSLIAHMINATDRLAQPCFGAAAGVPQIPPFSRTSITKLNIADPQFNQNNADQAWR